MADLYGKLGSVAQDEDTTRAINILKQAEHIHARLRMHGGEVFDSIMFGYKTRLRHAEPKLLVDIALECLAEFQKRDAANNAQIEAIRRAQEARQEAASRALHDVNSRRQWADVNLRPLLNVGAALKSLAEEIADAKGTVQTSMFCGPATAPVGNADEYAACVETMQAKLATISKTLAALTAAAATARAALKA